MVKKCLAMFLWLSMTAGLLSVQQPLPIRLGDVARQLSDQDIATLERTLPPGPRPWLLIGEALVFGVSPPIQSVEAFLPPETATREIRRGSMIPLQRRIADPAKPEAWAIANASYPRGRIGSYAQVVIAGRNFEEIQGDEDINRPFVVDGRFDDAELVSILTFIRSFPVKPTPPGPPMIGGLPVHTIVRQPGDYVDIWTRRSFASSQIVTLRKQGQSWVVVSVGIVQA